MPDLISNHWSWYTLPDFTLQPTTNDQTLYMKPTNSTNRFIVQFSMTNVTQNTVIIGNDTSFGKFYEKTWSTTASESDFDPGVTAIIMELHPSQNNIQIQLRSLTAESAARTIPIRVAEESL